MKAAGRGIFNAPYKCIIYVNLSHRIDIVIQVLVYFTIEIDESASVWFYCFRVFEFSIIITTSLPLALSIVLSNFTWILFGKYSSISHNRVEPFRLLLDYCQNIIRFILSYTEITYKYGYVWMKWSYLRIYIYEIFNSCWNVLSFSISHSHRHWLDSSFWHILSIIWIFALNWCLVSR